MTFIDSLAFALCAKAPADYEHPGYSTILYIGQHAKTINVKGYGKITLEPNKTYTNKDRPAGYEVKDFIGRAWFVPHSAVIEDKARYHVEADGISIQAARKLVIDEDNTSGISYWFHEQYIFREVVRDGVMIKDITEKQKLKILDGMAIGDDNTYAWESPLGIKDCLPSRKRKA